MNCNKDKIMDALIFEKEMLLDCRLMDGSNFGLAA